jgi:hypothetical protein
MSMKVRENAMAPRQMTTAIIAPTTSPQVARSSIRGSGVFMVLSFTRSLAVAAGAEPAT